MVSKKLIVVLVAASVIITGCEKTSNELTNSDLGVVIETVEPTEVEVEEVIEAEPPVKVETAFYLTDAEREIVEKVVMGESGGEPYEGQVLVAQCLLNASLRDGIQPSEVRINYQYAGWNDNPSESVKRAVSAVFDEGYKLTDEFILYFYAPRWCNSYWHETQRFILEVGGHRFFAEWE